MIPAAHIAGVPVDELVLSLVPTLGAVWVALRRSVRR